MINHLRSLILNDSAVAVPGLHEEYIEPGYQPMSLGREESAVFSAIFPRSYPRDFRNFIVTALTRVVYNHDATAELMHALDPRLTFKLRSEPSLRPNTQVQLSNQKNADSIMVLGDFAPVETEGKFTLYWDVSKHSSTQVTIRNVIDETEATELVTFISDASALIPLGYGLSLRLVGVTSIPDFSARITAIAPMILSLDAVFGRLTASLEAREIFTANGVQLNDLSDLFQFSNRRDISLAALLAAYAIQLTSKI